MDEGIVKVAVIGAGGYAAYELLYKPWAIRRELQRLADQAALDALKKGGTKQAIENAIAGACSAGAAVYKMPPALAGPACQVVGLLAVKGAEAAVKGAKIAGKAIGKGVKAAYKAPKAGVKAIGKGVKSASHWFGLGGLKGYADGDFEDPHGGRNPFATYGKAPARKRRGLAGVSRSSSARAGAAFYARHL